ncbi:hypothetical protein DKX38_008670 [Salix brachista]|uniref:Bms1-type G domain-containing protein n=1 Tax=Salix brachista TaxID=2182728 RepID=A0A5N5MTJ6_9ROSI|nr:hypothetical protein DKX38_008670 [Salix brachista]
MGGSRAQLNKPHKSRFSTKSSRNLHKTSLKDKSRIAKSERNVAKGARAARLQRNKMGLWMIRNFGFLFPFLFRFGQLLFGLSASVNVESLAEDLLRVLSNDGAGDVSSTVASSEYKMRITVLKAPHGDLLSCMEMAKVADLIVFVASTISLYEENASDCGYIDSFGSQCLSVFRQLGLPNTAVFLRDLPSDQKGKNELKKLSISNLAGEFPEDCKFYPADTKDELHKFLWLFKEQRLTFLGYVDINATKGIQLDPANHITNQLGLVPESFCPSHFIQALFSTNRVDVVADDLNSGKCTLLLTGYLHAHSLSVNQLVHVSGAGDFQLQKIEILKDPNLLKLRKESDAMDSDDVEVVRSMDPDFMTQEQLVVENVPDPLAGEQTWPTEAEMAEADRNQKQKRLKKRILPRGTSEYQAAWIVDETDDEGSASGSDTDDGMVLDGTEEINYFLGMQEDDNLTREQIEEEIKKIKAAHAEDEEFPDEVDTPLDIPARKRFTKFRGLKSFRTSSWDPKESLPPEYARIFAFDNFAKTQKHVFAKFLDMKQENRDDCVPAGQYVRLHIKEVPTPVASKLCLLVKTVPIIASGLFQHESKMSVLHFSIKKHDTYDAPIKSKEELVFHVGFRQFVARPIFSTDDMNSDKHKMERFLHAGRFAVASIYAPISFPPLPLIVLKIAEGSAAPALAAVGSLRCIDPDRIILKKIVLTGYPQRVSKLKASVRYMFHSPEDVRWFKPVEVYTKCGRHGRIKEPLGTHGAMKCTFNGVLQQNDTVCMSLYKRAYPKWPEHSSGSDCRFIFLISGKLHAVESHGFTAPSPFYLPNP